MLLSVAGQPPARQTRTATVPECARRHGLELVRFAYLLCGDRHRAEDLTQEVLLAMYRRFGEDQLVAAPLAYARRSLVNLNISWRRRRSSTEVVVDLFPDTPSPGVDEDADHDQLWQALRRLPVRQRTVLVLRYYQDATDEQIGELLGTRPGTVRSLASRALAALRTDPGFNRLVTDGGHPDDQSK